MSDQDDDDYETEYVPDEDDWQTTDHQHHTWTYGAERTLRDLWDARQQVMDGLYVPQRKQRVSTKNKVVMNEPHTYKPYPIRPEVTHPPQMTSKTTTKRNNMKVPGQPTQPVTRAEPRDKRPEQFGQEKSTPNKQPTSNQYPGDRWQVTMMNSKEYNRNSLNTTANLMTACTMHTARHNDHNIVMRDPPHKDSGGKEQGSNQWNVPEQKLKTDPQTEIETLREVSRMSGTRGTAIS